MQTRRDPSDGARPSSTNYAAILFDLDNTLSDFTSAQAEALPGLLSAHGVVDPDRFVPVFQRLAAPLWHRLEAGEINLDSLNEDRFRLLVEHGQLHLDPTVLAPEYLFRLGTSGRLWPGALELLEELAGRVVMGVVTNGYAEVQRPRLAHFGLDHYFDSVTVSSEIGHAKPGRAFFEHALAALGEPDPSTVLVVGDSVSSDMAGGAGIGCATCWFNPDGRDIPSDGPRIDHVVSDLSDIATIVLR